MAGLFDRVRGLVTPRERTKPMSEQGVGGFAVYGGYINSPETNTELIGSNRWRTAADLLSNISIVAASVRYTLNLIARPSWSFTPADDTAEAKAVAEFMEEAISGIDTSWTRIIRRTAMYRFHGFGAHEWVLKRSEEGKIVIKSLESRPQHTIEKWDIDENGGINGIIQRDPQTGREIYLPRQKLLYLVDDTMTDRPDGMGWFRHLVEPANQLRSYLNLERVGYERDLAGTPIARAPLQQLNKLVKDGMLKQAQADSAVAMMKDFVSMRRKASTTGMLLDSATYEATMDAGKTVSPVAKWGLELLQGTQNSIDHLGNAIDRTCFEMALIMGTESLLVGKQGEGSRALSEDKSRNLYLTANSTLADMAEAVDRDLVDILCTMNGIPDRLKPKAKVEDVSFKNVEQIAKVLNDMASAGAILAPDDPAVNDVRDLMGVQHAPEMDLEMINALQGRSDPTKPSPEAALNDERAREQMAQAANDDKGGGPGGKPQPGKRPAAAKRAPQTNLKTLYVNRPLTNADELIAWAKAAGFPKTVTAPDMHVTVCFTDEPIDWTEPGDSFDTLRAEGGKRALAAFGKDGSAIVLTFELQELTDRWQQFIDAGASWKHDGYTPHISITYDGLPDGVDLDSIEPYTGPLDFGPEEFSEVKDDWADQVVEKRILAAVNKLLPS